MSTREIVAYCRVSTGEQEDDGLSLDAQVDSIRRWAGAKQYVLQDPHVYVEAKSGRKADNRAKFQEAIKKATELKAAFVVCKLDRFARSVKDAIATCERLHAGGADLVILDTPIDTTSPYGEAMFQIIAVFAQLTSRLIGAHTRDALDYKRRRGEALGVVPFGYRAEATGEVRENRKGKKTHVKRLTLDEREQRAIELMRSTEGSFGQKAKALVAAGLMSRSGNPLSAGQVRRILMQEATRGTS